MNKTLISEFAKMIPIIRINGTKSTIRLLNSLKMYGEYSDHFYKGHNALTKDHKRVENPKLYIEDLQKEDVLNVRGAGPDVWNKLIKYRRKLLKNKQISSD